MKHRTPKDVTLGIRMTREAKDHLLAVATQYGDPSAILREVLQAFVEGRVTITPSPSQRSLYVPGKQD